MNPEVIGRIIKKIRKDNKMTQADFADKFGVTYQAVSKWENGKSLPDISIIKRICDEYNIELNSLLNNEQKKVFNKKIIVPIIIVVLSIGILLATAIIYHNYKMLPTYEFKEITTTNKDFEIDGVASYSDNKQSLYVSNIKYIKEDNDEYQKIECTLYVEHGNVITNISEVKSDSAINKKYSTLNELLTSISFKIDNYANVCKHNDDHFIKIEATNKNDKVISYIIPLSFEDTCN